MNKYNNFWNWLVESASDHKAFQDGIRTNPQDFTVRGVYADYLQDNDLASEETLNFLRFNKRRATPTFINLPDGKVWAGHFFDKNEIINLSRGQGGSFFSPASMRTFNSKVSNEVFNGPGGTYFITSETGINTQENVRTYSVRKFSVIYPEGNYRISTVKAFPDLRTAKRAAKQLSENP